MPIVFQSPDPVSPGLSAAQGFADTWSKLFPSLASLYSHAASQQSGQQAQSAQLTQQAQQFQIAQENQGQLQTQQLQAGADAQQYQATQQSQLQDQKAQNEAWLNQQALTQADTMQMTRLQNHLSWLDTPEAAENLTPDQITGERSDTIGQLSKFQLRGQNAANNAMQNQNMMAGNVNAAGITRQMADMNLQAQNMAKNIVTKQLPDGSTVVMTPNGDGKWTTKHIPAPAPEDTSKADAAQAKADAAAQAAREKVSDRSWDQWHKVNDAALKEVNRKVEENEVGPNGEKTGNPRYPWLKDNEAFTAELNAERARRGLDYHTPDEYVNKRIAEHDAATQRRPSGNVTTREDAVLRGQPTAPTPIPNQAGPTPAPTPIGTTTAQPVPQMAPQAARTVQPPFSFTQGDRTEAQKGTVAAFDQYHKNITESNLWNTNKRAYDDAKLFLGTAQKLMEKYGSEQGMPEREKKLYDDSLNLYRRTVAPALQQQEQQKIKARRESVPEVAPFAS